MPRWMRGQKLLIALALSLALALGLSACGGGGDDSATGGETSAAAKPSDLSGTVTVWDIISGFSPTYKAASEKLDAAFEAKYPKVTIEHVDQPFANYTQIYKAAFTGHEGPDVMNFPGGNSGVLSYVDGLEPLNQYISDELQEALGGWEAVTPGFTAEGEHYGIPMSENGFAFYYNKKLFKQAGLPVEFEPKTWDDLYAAAEKLKAAGITPFVGGDKEGFENASWFSIAWQTMATEEQSVELGEGELPYTDQLVADAFGPLLKTQEAGFYNDDRFTTPYYPSTWFPEEKGAISYGQWATAAYYGEYAPELGAENLGLFFPPESKYLGVEPNWVWSIPKFAENKDAAWAYLEFLSSQEGMQMLVDQNPGEIPNRDDVKLPQGLAPQAYEIERALGESTTFPHALMFVPGLVWETMWTELSQVLQGRASLEDALQALQEADEKSGVR